MSLNPKGHPSQWADSHKRSLPGPPHALSITRKAPRRGLSRGPGIPQHFSSCWPETPLPSPARDADSRCSPTSAQTGSALREKPHSRSHRHGESPRGAGSQRRTPQGGRALRSGALCWEKPERQEPFRRLGDNSESASLCGELWSAQEFVEPRTSLSPQMMERKRIFKWHSTTHSLLFTQ